MKAIILAAGQGKRLLPLTADIPKALLDVGGHSLIARQVRAFEACGIREFVVITGYGADHMAMALEQLSVELNITIRIVFNPFYYVSDNLASCWLARTEMTGEFIQVNGDNVFQASLVQALLDAPQKNVSVAINCKNIYDHDDMKVMLDGNRVTEIGKRLPLEAVSAEAIGFYVFRGEGTVAYRATLEKMMQRKDSLTHWFPAAVGELAKEMDVDVIDVSTHSWCEVDVPLDLQEARTRVAKWAQDEF